MDFSGSTSRNKRINLGGRKKEELSSNQILAQAKADRARRHLALLQANSALCIQRHWRATRVRAVFRRHLASQWMLSYSSIVSDASHSLPASTMLTKVIPPIFFIYSHCSHTQHPSSSSSSIHISLPPLCSYKDYASLKGCLSLILRSLQSSDPHYNILSIIHTPPPYTDSNDSNGTALILYKLIQLCCTIATTPQCDALLKTAAARVVLSIFDKSKCKVHLDDDECTRTTIVTALLLQSSTVPPLAALPLLACRNIDYDDINNNKKKQQAVYNTLMKAHLTLVLQQQQQAQEEEEENGRQLLRCFVQYGLTAANFIDMTFPEIKSELMNSVEKVEVLLNSILGVVVEELKNNNSNNNRGRLTSDQLVVLLVNATQLIAGGMHHSTSSTNLTYFAPSRFLLESRQLAEKFVTMVNMLLQQGDVVSKLLLLLGKVQRSNSNSSRFFEIFAQGTLASCLMQSLPFEVFLQTYINILAAADIYSASSGCSTKKSSSSIVGTSSSTSSPSSTPTSPMVSPFSRIITGLALGTTPTLLSKMWHWLATTIGLPLSSPAGSTRGFLIPCLQSGVGGIQSPLSAGAFALFCRAYTCRLLIMDDVEFYEEQQTVFRLGEQRAIAASLNTLVFCSHIPIPASSSSSSSSSVRSGYSLSPRGVRGPSKYTPTTPLLLTRHHEGHYNEMLAQAAPELLSALYDRDVRRPYCSPQLWLEPYQSLIQWGQSLGNMNTVLNDGVLRVLQHALDDESGKNKDGGGEDEDDDDSSFFYGGDSNIDDYNGVTAMDISDDEGAEVGGPSSKKKEDATTTNKTALPMKATGNLATALGTILKQAPHCIPFEERLEVFRGLIQANKLRCKVDLAPYDGGPPAYEFTIRRNHLLTDAIAKLNHAGISTLQLRGRFKVRFYDAQGMEEMGWDMGGLTKELIQSVADAGFDPTAGFFLTTQDGEGYLYPNPLVSRLDGGIETMQLLGIILGKALYDGILLNAPLAPMFAAALRGKPPTFDDLATIEPQVFKSLSELRRLGDGANNSSSTSTSVDDLGLDFTIESDVFGMRCSEELVPGGGGIAVTAANIQQYVLLVANWHLYKRLGPCAAAFAQGLKKVIEPRWLSLFNGREINALLGGAEGGEIDVDDLKVHVEYKGGYTESSRTVSMFWKVFGRFSKEEKGQVLKFVTSCARPPLGGFKQLNPPFTIHKVDCDASLLAVVGKGDVDRLPSASTCTNLLKLPNYRTESVLREKLLYAIQSGAGFDLS